MGGNIKWCEDFVEDSRSMRISILVELYLKSNVQ